MESLDSQSSAADQSILNLGAVFNNCTRMARPLVAGATRPVLAHPAGPPDADISQFTKCAVRSRLDCR